MIDDWDDDTETDDACTQDTVARHLARDQAGRLRYCAEQRAWYVFDGAIWRRDRTGLVLQRARELTRALGTKPTFGIVSARFASERPAWSNMRFVSGVEKFARADPAFAVTADVFDADPFLLGTPDGPVALKSGRKLGADPGQNLSKATAVGPAETAACPRWRTFLDQTFDDPALILFLQRYFGYALTGDTSERVLLFGHGTGGNGKSVFARTIAGLMGDYAETCAPGTFTRAFTCAGGGAERHPTEIARLAGARLVSHAETASAHAWDETRIKLLTGGDPVTARFTHADAFTFTPRFKLFILGNHRPALARVDEAMARRLLIVPFRHRPDVPDRGLPDALKAEWPGILRWLIDGCLAWLARGLDPPASVREATADYLAGEDVLGQFLDEACACAPGDPTKTAPSGALFAAWSSFARDAGAPIGSPRGFAEALQARGFFRARIHAGRIFCGVSLKADTTMSVTP